MYQVWWITLVKRTTLFPPFGTRTHEHKAQTSGAFEKDSKNRTAFTKNAKNLQKQIKLEHNHIGACCSDPNKNKMDLETLYSELA